MRNIGGGWPRYTPEFPLDTAKSALVVVDVQNTFADPGHLFGQTLKKTHPTLAAYYFDRVDQLVVPNLRSLIDAYWASKLPRIRVIVASRDRNGRDMGFLITGRSPFVEMQVGLETSSFHFTAAGAQPWRDVPPEEDELVIFKQSLGAMNASSLAFTLQNLGVESIVVTGLTTDCCVEQTATVAAEIGFRTNLVDDACATFDQETHDAALSRFWRYFGNVVTTRQVLENLESASPLAAAQPAASRDN